MTKTITVRRQQARFGMVRKVWVRVDGRKIDNLAAGESVTLEIPDTAERLRVALDGMASRPLPMSEIEDRGVVEVSVADMGLKVGVASLSGLVLAGWLSGVIGAAVAGLAIALIALIGAVVFSRAPFRLTVLGPDPV